MTTRPDTAERDPLPEQVWTPTSHAWARRQALEAAAEAVARAKRNRTTVPDSARRTTTEGESDR